MPFPIPQARRHIERLERTHNIEARLITRMWNSEADSLTRQVWIPDPTTPLRYLIGLHEFGHVLDKVAGKVMKGSKPEEEAAAWRWAVANAEPDLMAFMSKRQWSTLANAWLTSVTGDGPAVG